MREKLIDVHSALMGLIQRAPYIRCADTDRQYAVNWLMNNGVTVQQWIPVSERLPEVETEVLILATRKIYSLKSRSHTIQYTRTTGMYEDGTKHTEDSEWVWETDGFEYDEELDDYIIPEGWWEYKHYNGDEDHNYAIDDVVTHWMPLPAPPKEERSYGLPEM